MVVSRTLFMWLTLHICFTRDVCVSHICVYHSIKRYLDEKKVVKCFVVVSDEGENAKHQGEFFHEVFHKYYHQVR